VGQGLTGYLALAERDPPQTPESPLDRPCAAPGRGFHGPPSVSLLVSGSVPARLMASEGSGRRYTSRIALRRGSWHRDITSSGPRCTGLLSGYLRGTQVYSFFFSIFLEEKNPCPGITPAPFKWGHPSELPVGPAYGSVG